MSKRTKRKQSKNAAAQLLSENKKQMGHQGAQPITRMQAKYLKKLERESASIAAKNTKPDKLWHSVTTFAVMLVLFFLLWQWGKSHWAWLYLCAFAGFVVELKKKSTRWREILFGMLAAICMILFGGTLVLVVDWFKGKDNAVNIIEQSIYALPFGTFAINLFFFSIFHEVRIMKLLGEGITFFYSVCFGYWLYSMGIFDGSLNILKWIVAALYGVLMLFSLRQVLSYRALSDGVRLALSIYNTIILLIFSIHYLINLGRNFNNTPQLVQCLQFFLLGISSMYIVQNASMLLAYLPNKHHFYGKSHRADIRSQNQQHILRFSPEQVSRIDALIIAAIGLTLIILNELFVSAPVLMTIWLMIFMVSGLQYGRALIDSKRYSIAPLSERKQGGQVDLNIPA